MRPQAAELWSRLAALEAGGVQSEAAIANAFTLDPNTGIISPETPLATLQLMTQANVMVSDGTPGASDWELSGTEFALAPDFGLVPSGAPLGQGKSLALTATMEDREVVLNMVLMSNAIPPTCNVTGCLFSARRITGARGSLGLELDEPIATTNPTPFTANGTAIATVSDPVEIDSADGILVLGVRLSDGNGVWPVGGAATISMFLYSIP